MDACHKKDQAKIRLLMANDLIKYSPPSKIPNQWGLESFLLGEPIKTVGEWPV